MIYSDKWATYRYDHQTVNHSILKQAMEPTPTQLREDGIESRSLCLLRHVAQVFNPGDFSSSENFLRQEALLKSTSEDDGSIDERIHLRSFDRYDCVDN